MMHTHDRSILETEDSECEPSLGDIVRPYLKKKKKLGVGQEENKEQVEYEDERRKEERRGNERRGRRARRKRKLCIHMESLMSDPNKQHLSAGGCE